MSAAQSQKFKELFKPIKIGNVLVRNRITMAPMTTLYAGPDGEVTDQCIEYYGARAKGGTGLITVEGTYISPLGLQIPDSISVCDDKFVPGLARLADSIKRNGAVAVLQLIHSGIQAWVPQTVGPSPVGRIMGKPISSKATPHELTIQEIEQIIQDFGNAAFRAMMAGFDMVQLHGTHGYLIHQFLSPLTNKRGDKYGADRDLFALEVYRGVREKCGPNYPIIFRLCADEALGDERLKDGITLDDAKKTAQRLVKEGVDALDVTGGQDDVIDQYVPSAYVLEHNQGTFLHLASEIKKLVNVPVISGGAIETPEVAEKAIKDGTADMVFLGRQLIADPEWAAKAEEGRPEERRPCVKCMHCGDRILALKPVNCAVNPLAGFEYKYMSEDDIPPARNKKKILVIGGGPGGLECARIATKRGHDVTVVEKSNKLGGTVKLAAIPSFKQRSQSLIDWYEDQIKKLGVKVKTKTNASVGLIKELDPDVVVVATGAEPMILEIPGIEKSVTADDVLLGKVDTGQNVIVIGGGLVGSETAMYLAKQNRKVTILEALPALELAMTIVGIAFLKPGGLFAKYGIEVITGASVVEIKDGEVVTTDKSGEKKQIKADTIINAMGRQQVLPEELVSNARAMGKSVFVIGDAKAPRETKDAIREGFMTALNM